MPVAAVKGALSWRVAVVVVWFTLLLLCFVSGCAHRPCACACSCDEAGVAIVSQLEGENQRLRAQLDFWRERAVQP